jgi:hypothetical protein
LAEAQGLPIGVVEDAVVGKEVEHPRGQGFESREPLSQVGQEPDQDLDGRLVGVLLEPARVPDLSVGLAK